MLRVLLVQGAQYQLGKVRTRLRLEAFRFADG